MSRRNPYQRRETENPLSQPAAEDNSLLQSYGQMYGGVDLPPSGRLIANPTGIYAIRPDLRQPRRAIPTAARGQWDGDPTDLPTILGNWHALVERLLGREIDIPKVIRGGERLDEAESIDPAVTDYLALLDLAASIFSDGLVNPIRIARGVIESGERRWLAYHVLNLYSGSDYSKIPAVEKSAIDVWAQAAENGARKPLNAIGMARQLALLIMDMYEGDDGVKFDPYDQVVLPGECDRRFYAQVRDGNIYRIKRGMAERILNVTGLKSKAQMSQYRALLNVPDDLWLKADVQNWTESEIRNYISAALGHDADDRLTTVNLSDSDEGDDDGDMLTTVNIDEQLPPTPSPQRTPPKAGPMPPPRTSVGERMGLYTRAATPPPPPAPRIDEDDVPLTPEEELMIQESLAGIDEELQAAMWGATAESTAPIAAEKAWAEAVALLKFLKATPGEEHKLLRQRMTELMTVSRQDLQKWMSYTDQTAWWEQTLVAAQQMASERLEAQFAALTDYLNHLNDVGKEMDERRRQR